jgi:hypothetical protein
MLISLIVGIIFIHFLTKFSGLNINKDYRAYLRQFAFYKTHNFSDITPLAPKSPYVDPYPNQYPAYSWVLNYPPLYNVLVFLISKLPIPLSIMPKILPIVFTYLLGFLIFKIILFLTNNKNFAIGTGSLVPFLPMIFFENYITTQVDTIYLFFALLSFYYLLKKDLILSFVWLFVGFAIKQHILFFAPVLFYFWLRYLLSNNGIKKWKVIISPLYGIMVYVLLVLPEVIFAKWPISSLFVINSVPNIAKNLFSTNNKAGIYFTGAGFYNLLSFFKPLSISYIFAFAISILIILLSVIILFFMFKNKNIDKNEIILVSSFLSLITVFVFTGTHERYFFIPTYLGFVACLYLIFKITERVTALFIYVAQEISMLLATLNWYWEFLPKIIGNVGLKFAILLNILCIFILAKKVYGLSKAKNTIEK